ncbi:MAG TPA: Uma2 family endonuclease [Blastocatellia bacterium]|nr:Uma2 family endonuclease [Blastocatellia bacterium]
MATETLEQPTQLSPSLALDVHSVQLTDEQFYRLCRDNRDYRIELTAQGKLIVMPPTGSMTGWRNARIIHRLTAWTENEGKGLTFDSSTGFTLPNGAKRSPDASWVKRERWDALTEQEKEKFAPLCPDFVVELRSPDDTLATLQEKMAEYIENGAQLGWLIDPKNKQVYVYRPGQPVECLDNAETVSGDPVLSGFVLNLKDIWNV